MTAKLKIGSGLHRARRNRSRGPRPAKPITRRAQERRLTSALSAPSAFKKLRRARK